MELSRLVEQKQWTFKLFLSCCHATDSRKYEINLFSSQWLLSFKKTTSDCFKAL